jgi:transposase-like protein
MGRKSSLTPEQWAEVERRHLVGGESINSLAKEFGIAESSVRRKIKPNNAESEKPGNPLLALAQEKVRVEQESREITERIAELPFARQNIVNDLARKLANISMQMGSAAEYAAANTHRLMGIAHLKIAEIDDAAPFSEESRQVMKDVAAVTALANESSKIPLNLLAANKEAFSTPAGDEEEKGKPRYIVAPPVAESNEQWAQQVQSHQSK